MEKITLKYSILVSLFFICFQISANNPPVKLLPDISVRKTGLLIGAQKGKYFGIELGTEMQWKQIKINKPFTFALAAVGDYQFGADVLSLKVGPWFRFGRLAFTYGTQLTISSDFTANAVAITPSLGFKLLGFHLIAGYNLYGKNNDLTEYNTLHLSLRYFISKDRDFKIQRDKKKKKN